MLHEIIGESPAVRRFRKNLPSLAKETGPILITGEGGVGKSFWAAHLHAAGPFADHSPAILNFSTLPERDQRIGLFGAEPPELTTSRRGVLERNTTAILKHIDCANVYLQEKLADALTSFTVVRPGSSEVRDVKAKVIFTFRHPLPFTNRKQRMCPKLLDLLTTMKKIYLHPLRERREDIPLLALSCADRLREENEVLSLRGIGPDRAIDPALLSFLNTVRWEENVRDLFACIRSLAMFPLRQEIVARERIEVIKMAMMIDGGEEFSLAGKLATIEREMVRRAIRLTSSRSKAARILGLSERSIGRMVTLLLVAGFFQLKALHATNI